jgi:hypothetical protein
MSHKALWAWYAGSAFLVLLIKLASYCYHGRQMGHPVAVSIREWFLERTLENAASWTASVINLAAAWTIGRIYISQMTIWGVAPLPLDIGISCLLGCSVEITAPNFAKWLVSKIPGGGA